MSSTAQLLESAIAHHERGEWAAAETLYRQIIQAEPFNADAHNLLGVLAHQCGNQDAAAALMRRAIELNPFAATFHSNLGLVLKQQGHYAEAVLSCRRALALQPDFADAHSNLGIALMAQGDWQQAIEGLREAVRLNPCHVQAHNNLGLALAAQGWPTEALEHYKEALRLNPDFADAWSNLGIVLKDMGQLENSIDCYQKALALNPNHANALNNLGAALKAKNLLSDAVACYQRALLLNPNNADMLGNLGLAYRALGRKADAMLCFRRALQSAPSRPQANCNLGVMLLEPATLTEAIAYFREAVRLDPGFADAFSNLGLALRYQGQYDEAMASFNRAIALEPEHVSAHANRALLRLLVGDFSNGWPEYEYRWRQPERVLRHSERPRWDGSSSPERTIILYAEQGFGDTVQFIRYAALVKERVGTVLFECQPELVPLIEGTAGCDIVIATGTTLPPFDVQLPLLSLPGVFQTTFETIPAAVPYLRANTARISFWKKELESFKGLKIGIAWQGSPTYQDDLFRSAPLASFAPLGHVRGVSLISLQVGAGAEQLASFDSSIPILDLGERLGAAGFCETAAVIMNLDLVITVDSVLAHLAGALGRPVWTLVSAVPDWRWFLGREGTPWYPTMRLFRQERLGDWQTVFERIITAVGQVMNMPNKN